MTRHGSPTAAARALLADCHTGLGLLLSDRRDPAAKAEAEHRQAMAITRKLVDDNPGVADFLGRLADSHYNLAGMAWRLNKLLEAEAEYRRAMALYRKLADDHPAVTEYRKRLADCHNSASAGADFMGTGTEADSDVELREAQRIRRKLADDYPGVTGVPQTPGGQPHRPRLPDDHSARPAEAEAEYRQAVALYPEAGRRPPDHHGVSRFPGGQPREPRRVRCRAGKPAEAEAEHRQAMALYQKLADDEPAVYGSQVGFRYIDPIIERAERLSREGKRAEAEAAYREALSSYQKLADDHPGVTEFRVRLALSHFQFGVQLSWWGKLTEAEAEYRRDALPLPEACRRAPRGHRLPEATGLPPQQSGPVPLADRQAAGSRGRVPPGAGDRPEADRRTPRRGLLRREPGGVSQNDR